MKPDITEMYKAVLVKRRSVSHYDGVLWTWDVKCECPYHFVVRDEIELHYCLTKEDKWTEK